MSEATCSTCRYWHSGANPTDGQCRRYPPVLVVIGSEVERGVWPETYPGDWCGEHQPAPPEQG